MGDTQAIMVVAEEEFGGTECKSTTHICQNLTLMPRSLILMYPWASNRMLDFVCVCVCVCVCVMPFCGSILWHTQSACVLHGPHSHAGSWSVGYTTGALPYGCVPL
jgi:hypothetical protein